MKDFAIWIGLAVFISASFGLASCYPIGANEMKVFVSPVVVSEVSELVTQANAQAMTPSAKQGPSLIPTPLVRVSPVATPDEVVRFRLDLPLKAAATQVTGRGPVGLGIVVIDVTRGVSVIGTGQIGAEGTFVVDVQPLIAGDRVGIMVDGQSSEKLGANLETFWGEGGIQLPMFGDVFVSAMVSQ